MSLRDDLEQWVSGLDDFTTKRLTEHLVIDDNYAQFREAVKNALNVVEDDVNNTAYVDLAASQVAALIASMNSPVEW
jgi:hypothetical protein